MKKVNTILKMTALILTVITSTGCNNFTPTNEEAKELITIALGLPKNVTVNVTGADVFKWPKLRDAGFIYDPGNCSFGCDLQVTVKGEQYLLKDVGEGGYPMEYNTLIFQGYRIDLGDVTGIAVDKKQQIVLIRFYLKATNITPISEALHDNINTVRNSELIFKKFNNGWQLASENNKSKDDLLRNIWWSQDE